MKPLARCTLSQAAWLLFLLLAPAPGYTQDMCPPGDCACLEKQGQALEETGKFGAAIRQYQAAKECDPDNAVRFNRRIEAVFAKINGLKEQALQDEQRAQANILKTAALQTQADKDTREAARQQQIALEQIALADSARTAAEASRRTADSLQSEFQKQVGVTKATLSKLDKALNDLALEYARQADLQIYTLEYDSARTLAGKASALRRPAASNALKRLYLELTYVYNEAGQAEQAAPMADSLAHWHQTDFDSDTGRIARRAKLERLDSAGFSILERRYYPAMIAVNGGTFTMGTTRGQRRQVIKTFAKAYGRKAVKDWTRDEMPAHPVTLSTFQMARTETNWWQYGLYCRATGIELPRSPSWGRSGDHPVVNVSWADAQEYIKWLNTRDTAGYRLPTEAEWEYAARGGVQAVKDNFDYAGSNNLDDVAWYDKNSNGKTHPVAEKRPNALGLYDLSGNAWEWCSDWYGAYPANPEKDYAGPPEGSYRVVRGGSWYYDPEYCRVANRVRSDPDYRNRNGGFRLVFVP